MQGHVVVVIWGVKLSTLGLEETGAYAEFWRKSRDSGVKGE